MIRNDYLVYLKCLESDVHIRLMVKFEELCFINAFFQKPLISRSMRKYIQVFHDNKSEGFLLDYLTDLKLHRTK